MPDTDPADGSTSDLTRLIGQLWGTDAGGRIVGRVGGSAPAGYEVVERYAALPRQARAQVLVPAGRPQLARRALLLYNGLRIPRTRFARRVLAEAIGLGLVGTSRRDLVLVCARLGDAGDEGEALSLLEHLRRTLGVSSLEMSPAVPSAAPNSKPTALLLDAAGAPRGYLKLGWNVATSRMVRNEAQVLGRARKLASLDVPRVLHEGDWEGHRLLVSSPLPESRPVKQVPSRLPPLALTAEVAGMSAVHEAELGASRYWGEVQDRIAGVEATTREVALWQPLTAFVSALERRCAGAVLTFGAWHGDWVPWNMAWFGGRLVVWDWEHSSDAVPLGFDALHYVFQHAFIYRREGLASALGAVDQRAGGLLGGLRVRGQLSVTSLYLLEQVLRSAETARDGGGWNPRLLGPVPEVLAARTELLRSPVSS